MKAETTQELKKLANRSVFVQPAGMNDANPLCAAQSKQPLAIIESIATGTPQNIVRQSEAAKFVANLPTLRAESIAD